MTEQTDFDESAIFSKWRVKLRQLPASDRAALEMLMDRLLLAVRAEAIGNSDQVSDQEPAHSKVRRSPVAVRNTIGVAKLRQE